jgi:acetoin:2,6-dichlorophenolindophenol oxidoreductase subunit beta
MQTEAPTSVRMTYLDALVEAQIEEMKRDERVILMAEDVAIYGSGDLLDKFGGDRIWAMPISEGSFTGVGIGAAVAGLRPIVDLSIASFAYLAADQIINQAAKLHFMTGGQVRVPIVFRLSMYYAESLAAQHSDRPYPLFMNVPGLKIVCPTSAADVKGLLKASVRDDDPVVFFEDMKLWTSKDDVPTDPDYLLPLGKADVKQIGSDVTIVAIGGAMRATLKAAKALQSEGIHAEVIDPRTLKPLDTATIIASVAKTGRLVIVENAHRCVSASSEIAAIVAEEAFDSLKKPIIRLTAPDSHVPFSPVLEALMYPQMDQIVSAVRKLS